MTRPTLPSGTVVVLKRLDEPPEQGRELFLARRGNLKITVRYFRNEYCLWGCLTEGNRHGYTVRALGRQTLEEVRREIAKLARETF